MEKTIHINFCLTLLIFTFFTLNKISAQCSYQIGELQVLNYQHKDGIFICNNDTLKVEVENYELADSQQMYYAYHDEVDLTSSLVLQLDTTETEGFINKFSSITKLYVTALITKTNIFGLKNIILDSCTVFSNTVEVVCLTPVEFIFIADRSDFKFNLLPSGGLPQFDSLYKYTISGNTTDTLSIGQIGTYNAYYYNNNEAYNLHITDENKCKISLTKTFFNVFTFPIKLESFTGKALDGHHILEWYTLSEIDSEYFILHICKEDGSIEMSHNIPGARTTSQTSTYGFLNENVSPGQYIYKLFNISFDGESTQLGAVELTAIAQNPFPNPTKDVLHFPLQNTFTNLRVQIFDLNGYKIQSFCETQIQIIQQGFTIDVSMLPSGIYFAQILADELELMEKFVVEN